MIVVRLMGGLGNQMFQYAFGKMLAVKHNTTLKLDTTLLQTDPGLEHAVVREFDLDIFDIDFQFASQQEVNYFNGYPNGSFFKRAWFKVSKAISPRHLIIQRNHDFSTAQLQLQDNTCLVGRWQSFRYFETVSDTIKKEFTIKKEWLLQSRYNDMIKAASEPVAIHVRRGDYVTNPLYSKQIGALTADYYKQAHAYLVSQLKNPAWFIFSDDLVWCRQHLDFIGDATYVTTERTKKGTAEDLHLLTLCRHHIISNSTFSWWGAYLSRYENKQVVAPARWANNKAATPAWIVPDSWHKI